MLGIATGVQVRLLHFDTIPIDDVEDTINQEMAELESEGCRIVESPKIEIVKAYIANGGDRLMCVVIITYADDLEEGYEMG